MWLGDGRQTTKNPSEGFFYEVELCGQPGKIERLN